MKVLLDTCIISDIYRSRKAATLQKALKSIGEENCFVSVVTLGAIANEIYLLKESKKKKELLNWIEQFEKQYNDRIISIDAQVTKIWGELIVRCKHVKKTLSMAEGLIAATAICHGLHVMTENIKDFEPTGVLIINPY